MREIKFRAWDTKDRKWIGFNDIKFGANGAYAVVYYDPERGDVVQAGMFKLMQYTGLKDKTGKEIYEGDILTIPIGNFDPASRAKAPSHWVVEWDEDGLGYQLVLTKKEHDMTPVEKSLNFGHKAFTGLYKKRGPEAEVIGNIYENKELLDA